MQNYEILTHHRNKTLPLKINYQIRSANKIKITTKGLPKDFFQTEAESHFLRPNKIRCKTQPTDLLQETSHFQHHVTPQPKRQGRQYKSQQRKRSSKKRIDGLVERTDQFSLMDCTFFKRFEEQKRRKKVGGIKFGSERMPHPADELKQSPNSRDLILNKSDLNSIFKGGNSQKQVKFNRLGISLSRGPFPQIRMGKRTN